MDVYLHAFRRFALLFARGLLTACSTTRPWVNQPLTPSAQLESPPALEPMLPVSAPSGSPGVVAAVALSGGGARAAAFGLGVLEELKATRLQHGNDSTTLLDEAGRRTLRASAEFQKLVQALQAQDTSVADAGGAISTE